jgi:Ni,Fe-hydrogenase maturation factor
LVIDRLIEVDACDFGLEPGRLVLKFESLPAANEKVAVLICGGNTMAVNFDRA